jgi:SAM-dependent methyltransferase
MNLPVSSFLKKYYFRLFIIDMIEEKYASGSAVYGDDFNLEQIQEWYDQEAEAYADLGSKEFDKYTYEYHPLNNLHGYKYLPDRKYDKVLGLGAAWGHEFYPIIDKISDLHIIEPSDNLRSEVIKHLKPVYTKPTVEGTINYPDNYFDLTTCFGVIHHIPNVTLVLKELYRVTKPGGYLLLREPVISMGDWTKPRKGLTRNERGIPLDIFRSVIRELNAEIINEGLCFCMESFLQRGWQRISNRPLHTFKGYMVFDKWLSKLFAWNIHYHATKKLERIAPQSVYYVLRKR